MANSIHNHVEHSLSGVAGGRCVTGALADVAYLFSAISRRRRNRQTDRQMSLAGYGTRLVGKRRSEKNVWD